eukprot:Gb_39232 [translate_table: standard]
MGQLRIEPKTDEAHCLNFCWLLQHFGLADGAPVDATGIQLPGVLDDLFSYEGPLGPTFTEDAVMLHLWAPTAQCVRAFIYSSPKGGVPLEDIQLQEDNGVWSTCGPRNWEGKYYLYEVTVFHHSTQRVEICLVNDPYSRGLSANGQRSLLINLNDESLKPQGWDNLADEKPQLEAFSDIAIYELHIRDFRFVLLLVSDQFYFGIAMRCMQIGFDCVESWGRLKHNYWNYCSTTCGTVPVY